MERNRQQARDIVARGVSAWERDDFESALLTFREVLDDHPSFADVHNKAGLCLAMLGRMEEGLHHFDEALKLNADYAEALLNRGIVLNELGRHDEAQAAFDRSSELDSQDSTDFPSDVGNRIAVTHAQLGDLYLVANHAHEAAKHYKAALEIRPRFMDIRSKFAESLIQQGALHKAKEELEMILEARPHFVGARMRMGVVLHRLGDNQAAVREWKRCAAEDPEDMRARAYLASVGVTLPAPN